MQGVPAAAPAPRAQAEPGPAVPPRPPRPSVQVPLLEAPPRLEAFLDMHPGGEVEAQMARVDGFVQREPEDGKPASQKTDVYLGYDRDNLYVVFVAFDDEPHKMRASLPQRENVFGDETVEIQLDTYLDQRQAFSFLTNPFGVQWDAMWIEGQGFDGSFDTVWHSTGRLTESGYVVWMAIPFKSLRFAPLAQQEWGVLLVRDIPRNNETSFWPPVSSRLEGRLNQAGRLTGLADISPGRNIQFIPYGTSRSFKALEPEAAGGPDFLRDDADTDLGVDAKLVLRDSLALDLTLNPDFSQVESDEPQVTVNERFEVFFPEKRPFFLENASLFTTPINLLFTRRIADPRHGARLTGKMRGTSLGVLLIDDEAPGRRRSDTDPLQGEDAAFGILRLSQDVGRQSNVGLMYTQRTFGDAFNRVASADARFKLNDNWSASLQTVATNSRLQDGTDLGGPAHSAFIDRNGRRLNTHTHYQTYSEGFRTLPGFVPRVDIRDAHNMVRYAVRPEGKRLIAWEPGLYVQRIEDTDGERLDWNIDPSINWELRRQTRFGVFGRIGRERIRPRDFPGLTESLDFSRDFIGAWVETRFVDPVDLELNVQTGDGINFVPPAGEPPGVADRFGARAEVVLRPLRRLRIDTSWLYTRLEAPDGGAIFSNSIVRTRWGWQFTPQFSVRTIFQYDVTDAEPERTSLTDAKSFNADLLFTYRANPWTAVYLGYNSNYRNLALLESGGMRELVRTDDDFLNDARQFFVKISYLIRL